MLAELLEACDDWLRDNEQYISRRIARFLRSLLLVISGGRHAFHATLKEYVLVAFSLAYLISPIDVVPDLIPLVGLIDDIIVLLVVTKILADTMQFASHIIDFDQRRQEMEVAHLEGDQPDQVYDAGAVECVVCREEYGPGENHQRTALVQCGHVFCHACAMQLIQRQMTCPICRANIEGVIVLP